MILRSDASRQSDKVAQGSGTDLKIVYCIEVRGQHLTTPLRPFYLPLMRKIETQMIAAVQNDERWASANTTVIPGWEGTSDVYLHGNLIATIGEDWMQLFDGGYQSKTTKSRLNALLSAFGMDGEYVFQKNFQWFVNYQGSPIPFFDGMRLA